MKFGRPPLLEAKKKAQITCVRLLADERALVEKAAKKNGQNLSAWVRKVLVKAATATLKSKAS